MKIVIDVLNFVGFYLLLDCNIFRRWYLDTILCGKLVEKYNKLDRFIVEPIINPKGMKDFDLIHKQPLGFLLLFIGAALSIIMDSPYYK